MYTDDMMRLCAQIVQTPYETFSRDQCLEHVTNKSAQRRSIFADLVRVGVFEKVGKTFQRSVEGLLLCWPEKYHLLTEFGGLGYFRGFIYALPNGEPHICLKNGVFLDRAIQGIKQQEGDISLLKDIYRSYPLKNDKGIYLSALYFWANITLSVKQTGTAYFPHQTYYNYFKDKPGITISRHEKEGGFYLKWDMEKYERSNVETETS